MSNLHNLLNTSDHESNQEQARSLPVMNNISAMPPSNHFNGQNMPLQQNHVQNQHQVAYHAMNRGPSFPKTIPSMIQMYHQKMPSVQPPPIQQRINNGFNQQPSQYPVSFYRQRSQPDVMHTPKNYTPHPKPEPQQQQQPVYYSEPSSPSSSQNIPLKKIPKPETMREKSEPRKLSKEIECASTLAELTKSESSKTEPIPDLPKIDPKELKKKIRQEKIQRFQQNEVIRNKLSGLNTKTAHMLIERRKRRQLSYLYKNLQMSLGVDPSIKLTVMDTLLMAINKLSDGKIKPDLDSIEVAPSRKSRNNSKIKNDQFDEMEMEDSNDYESIE